VDAPSEPDDAVLLELGRMTWAAINLEDIIPTMRRAIGPEPKELSRAPASEWIKDALKLLAGWPESEAREAAIGWFESAQRALKGRNQVLHSVPVTLVTRHRDGRFTEHGQVLDHLPRGTSDSFARTPLAENDLRQVSRRLAAARQGWVEICEAMMEERQRNDGQ
jgi:hypothetical protein